MHDFPDEYNDINGTNSRQFHVMRDGKSVCFLYLIRDEETYVTRMEVDGLLVDNVSLNKNYGILTISDFVEAGADVIPTGL